ncbi:ParB/RepB/Spo0J family partition protein [Salmonella enterica]|nr:ParB/RepB/Spo0J family partition protein [Salmonella enterica]
MSVTESKAKKAKKASPKAAARKADAQSDVLVAALDNSPVRYTAWSRLFIGELNCRVIPHTPEEIRGYADSIHAVGQIHNIVVVECDDGRLEVVCGGGRTKAIGLLVEEGKVNPDHEWISYKAVPRELARAVSLTENGRHKTMHPAEQIAGFRALAEEGKTPAQIGDLLGYGVKHVQRMLKLAGLAPVILQALAEDRITTEHCQALSLEDNPDRQVQVYEAACRESWNNKPEVRVIRNLITESQVSTLNNSKYAFVGEKAFSGDEIRADLFSDEQGGFVDKLALDTALLEKLQVVAECLKEAEGWAWATGRMELVSSHGEDSAVYRIQDEPDAVYTEQEQQRMDELQDQYDENQTASDETDALESEMEAIDCAAQLRAWTPEMRAQSGVVVSWRQGDVYVQRGVILREQSETEDEPAQVKTYERQPEPVDEISVPLLTRMCAERTLAVQAALMQQPEKSVALLAWTLCLNVFGSGAYNRPAQISLDCKHYSLTNTAPSGKEGMAFLTLMQEGQRLEKLLPEGWKQDFTTFFTLSTADLLALLSFCTACSLDGMQTRGTGGTTRSPLDALETALTFHLRDWWQPTKVDFFTGLRKPQIIAALNEAGLTGAARDAEKMKKGDAAELAEDKMRDTRWVPVWMRAPDAEKSPSDAENDVSDTENGSADAPDAAFDADSHHTLPDAA